MNAIEIRQTFLDFFSRKDHKIVSSAPIVLKNDPTLMFTNAGMNQFKDFFLGNKPIESLRIANSQKCLRVTGKHNDLEEVGLDSYHHTMFEMLGNWSFGDYFKKEAISWAWELLTEVYKIDKKRLYATVYEGDEKDGLGPDVEAENLWKEYLPEERILRYSKKDNFWEMGATGPCGPCSEIHVDIRTEEERKEVSGAELVNQDHPLVIEIWNLVFIQYQRMANGDLEELPSKHVDTGMGFERLSMVLQHQRSNYDTDIFSPFISLLEEKTGKKYTGKYEREASTDIAMRVIADHIRAVAFGIADGEMPSNTGAGYVLRRILRRAIRYYYSFLGQREPLLYSMVPLLADFFTDIFPELKAQESFVSNVILEEEKSFLRTLEDGLKRISQLDVNDMIPGETAFELYDTYGFPIDLTRLIATENGWTVDESGFEMALAGQRDRSRSDALRTEGDWLIVGEDQEVEFCGYDHHKMSEAQILKHRTISVKDGDVYQLVLNKTAFYPEGGGQVGDQGVLTVGDETIQVLDTKKENNLIIHHIDKIPNDPTAPVSGSIDLKRRKLIENNHSATHLLHAALREVLGDHVTQKGSLVKDEAFRFDFSHFKAMTKDEVDAVERMVNDRIRQNIARVEDRSIAINEAKEKGAMMLFGEKYGDQVRMITFDPDYSVELCGGCHVSATGKIGLFKIISETGIAAGVRRIEAITASGAENYVSAILDEMKEVKSILKSQNPPVETIVKLQEENRLLKKELEKAASLQAGSLKDDLIKAAIEHDGYLVITKNVGSMDAKTAKTLSYNIEQETGNAVVLLGLLKEDKPQLMLTISQELVTGKGLHAGNLIKQLSANIKGGGGGQAFFATAGGSDQSGLDQAINELINIL